MNPMDKESGLYFIVIQIVYNNTISYYMQITQGEQKNIQMKQKILSWYSRPF